MLLWLDQNDTEHKTHNCLIKVIFPIDFNRFNDFDFKQQEFSEQPEESDSSTETSSDWKSDSLLATRKGGSLQLSERESRLQETHRYYGLGQSLSKQWQVQCGLTVRLYDLIFSQKEFLDLRQTLQIDKEDKEEGRVERKIDRERP